MFQKKYFIYLVSSIALILIAGCGNNTDKIAKTNNDSIQNAVDTASKSQKTVQPIPYTLDTLSINDVTFNNQKAFLSNTEFNQYFKVDSSKTDIWECGNPFTYLDKEWMEKKYGKYDVNVGNFKNFDGKITTYFVGNAQFSSNSNKVLFSFADAKNNKLSLPNNNINLDENTTIEDFKKLFPKKSNSIEPMEAPHVQQIRLQIGKNINDAWIFTFKNGKLESYTLWWELC